MKTNPSYCLVILIIEVLITTTTLLLSPPLAVVNKNVVSFLFPVSIILYPLLFVVVQSLNLPPPQKRNNYNNKFLSSDSDTSSSTTTTKMSSSSVKEDEEDQQRQDKEGIVVLTSKCACGSLSLQITIRREDLYDNDNDDNNHNAAVDCHCTQCRHYHVSGFTSYLQIPADTTSTPVKWTNISNNNKNINNMKATYRDTCDHLGNVERIYCSNCKTKMATEQILLEDDDNDKASKKVLLVNLGSVQDESIPTDIALKWQTNRQQWQLTSKQYWPYAIPSSSLPVNNDSSKNKKKKKKRRDIQPTTTKTLPNIIKGGCRCGQCKYLINFGRQYMQQTEFQHCYCKLCRQLSGSAFQTWVPIMESNFQWQLANSQSLQLIRTTNHGQRHICRNCGSVMTIKYDSQPDAIWPAAGSLDDDNFDHQYQQQGDNDNDDDDNDNDNDNDNNNNNNNQIIQYYYYPVDYLYRVCHICVAWKQDWYQIPVDDGLERIQYAC